MTAAGDGSAVGDAPLRDGGDARHWAAHETLYQTVKSKCVCAAETEANLVPTRPGGFFGSRRSKSSWAKLLVAHSAFQRVDQKYSHRENLLPRTEEKHFKIT